MTLGPPQGGHRIHPWTSPACWASAQPSQPPSWDYLGSTINSKEARTGLVIHLLPEFQGGALPLLCLARRFRRLSFSFHGLLAGQQHRLVLRISVAVLQQGPGSDLDLYPTVSEPDFREGQPTLLRHLARKNPLETAQKQLEQGQAFVMALPKCRSSALPTVLNGWSGLRPRRRPRSRSA